MAIKLHYAGAILCATAAAITLLNKVQINQHPHYISLFRLSDNNIVFRNIPA